MSCFNSAPSNYVTSKSAAFASERLKTGLILLGVQGALCVFYTVFAEYAPQANAAYAQNSIDPIFGGFDQEKNVIKNYYTLFQDIHVMIFIGFGYLMVFLKRYGYSSIGFTFLLGSFTVQWSVLCLGFYELNDNYKIELGIESSDECVQVEIFRRALVLTTIIQHPEVLETPSLFHWTEKDFENTTSPTQHNLLLPMITQLPVALITSSLLHLIEKYLENRAVSQLLDKKYVLNIFSSDDCVQVEIFRHALVLTAIIQHAEDSDECVQVEIFRRALVLAAIIQHPEVSDECVQVEIFGQALVLTAIIQHAEVLGTPILSQESKEGYQLSPGVAL
ncbi:hypothetical protein NQ315_007823 [Exocentrus adspersus]|uniref:Ammonium transporter AmtB-like domain-containing protein n=1 Tax=Exocentrus adspersus TaxID=1586481 RepID=A0AAV8W909_9CUCU|nr:hypothetical protein NQ315_007823 [Exocentrus adspersus]